MAETTWSTSPASTAASMLTMACRRPGTQPPMDLRVARRLAESLHCGGRSLGDSNVDVSFLRRLKLLRLDPCQNECHWNLPRLSLHVRTEFAMGCQVKANGLVLFVNPSAVCSPGCDLHDHQGGTNRRRYRRHHLQRLDAPGGDPPHRCQRKGRCLRGCPMPERLLATGLVYRELPSSSSEPGGFELDLGSKEGSDQAAR